VRFGCVNSSTGMKKVGSKVNKRLMSKEFCGNMVREEDKEE